MDILFVLNQLPFPPRNGTTVPTYNLLTGLSQFHNTNILLLRKDDSPIDSDMLENNRKIVDQLWISRMQRDRCSTTRIFSELLGREILHVCGRYDINELKKIIASNSFDAVVISGESILNVTPILKNMMPDEVIFIAVLNDSISAPFRQARKFILFDGMRFKDRLFNIIKWLRSSRVATIEKKILGNFELILLQTEEDRKNVNLISDNKYNDRILILPNGVNQALLDQNISSPTEEKVILFVGILSGNYSKIVFWILEKVWPLIKMNIPDVKFSVIGQGASEQLKSRMLAEEAIEYHEFIPDIIDVYKGKAVAVLPVFKGFGIINKVIESMASGVPVVGDISSFNGIDGFINGKHGIIAENEEEMASSVVELLRDDIKHKMISHQARLLVQSQFRWSDRVETLNQLIEKLHINSAIK